MSVEELVDYCARHDVRLQVAEGFLEWDAPWGVVTADVRGAIEGHAGALAAVVRERARTRTVPCVRCGRFHFVEPTVCHWCRQPRKGVTL